MGVYLFFLTSATNLHFFLGVFLHFITGADTAAINGLFHAQAAGEALEASITSALAGEDGKLSLMTKKAELEREGRTAAAFGQRMEEITQTMENTGRASA